MSNNPLFDPTPSPRADSSRLPWRYIAISRRARKRLRQAQLVALCCAFAYPMVLYLFWDAAVELFHPRSAISAVRYWFQLGAMPPLLYLFTRNAHRAGQDIRQLHALHN